MINKKFKEFAQKIYDNCETEEDKFKYEIILNILDDPECFKKMKTETAYKLLEDLKFSPDESKKIYNEIMLNLF